MSDICNASLASPEPPARTILTPAAGAALKRLAPSLRRRARFVAVAGLAVCAAAVVIVQLSSGPAPAMTPAPAPAASDWQEVLKPLAFFALPNTEFGREPTAYEARRHKTGGGRMDALSFGRFHDSQKPYLRLSLYRVGSEEAPANPFFVDMARRASEAKLAVTRSATPDAMTTRFGEFQVADIILASGKAEISCVGFRRNADGARLRIAGFACGTPTRPVDRAILACAIDRLDLVAAAEDPGLSAYFARAEVRRGAGCPQPQRIATAPVKESWLDAGGKLPPLRAALAQPPTKKKK